MLQGQGLKPPPSTTVYNMDPGAASLTSTSEDAMPPPSNKPRVDTTGTPGFFFHPETETPDGNQYYSPSQIPLNQTGGGYDGNSNGQTHLVEDDSSFASMSVSMASMNLKQK
jgi:hypothetical protein